MADILTHPATLVAFLREASAAPFAWGEWDCCMTLANWVRSVRGPDPADHLRGTYSDDAGWRKIVADQGGLIRVVEAVARRADMLRIHPDFAQPGDVAVARIGGNDFELGAICTGPDRWVVKLQRGVQRFPATRALAAWRL